MGGQRGESGETVETENSSSEHAAGFKIMLATEILQVELQVNWQVAGLQVARRQSLVASRSQVLAQFAND